MVKANISEIKNKLSHYIRLVKGGQEVEIVDRNTPVARIVGLDFSIDYGENNAFIQGAFEKGFVKIPAHAKKGSEFFTKEMVIKGQVEPLGVLSALIDERSEGR